ncbi:5-formyltetrahydrofolate cyclo-ligase [Metabacillus idriensis]|uniref:5-formyltetrahydrofolate cyclo-ligase n=1 Tax=Metabacillus idriensis TaxID=324768 RepID=UPI003D271EA7
MMKTNLRNDVKRKLKSLDNDTYEEHCERINKRLFAQPFWIKSETIAITISNGREVDTAVIIKEALRLNKRVAIPKCYPDQKKMEFRTFQTTDQLETVYFGLKEPVVSKTAFVPADEIDLLIVPGICFDRKGYRIGYGGGYYDRYMTQYSGFSVSLAFEAQLISAVPAEAHDLPVHQILTENEVIVAGG